MKRILCPTDFSQVAENAVTYAAKLAQRIGASLHLVHLHLLSDLAPEEVMVGSTLSNAQLSEMLKKESAAVQDTFKIRCSAEPVTMAGSLAKGLAGAATDFDYVVMGSNGEDDFFQRLFGSTTFRVIRRTRTPVFLVPENCKYKDITRVAYAFDYWRILDVPMEKIVPLSQQLGCSLTLVQVMEAYSADAEEELRATEAVLKERYAESINLSFKTLYDPRVVHGLREFMMKSDYDALALCFREGFASNIHTRVIREMSHDILYPIIAFH